MTRIDGVVIALVVDVEDPEGQGRIRLTFPWLAADEADAGSGWAPIARPMAGNDRGFHFLPEIGDEALVAFQHGAIDHPVVLGFLHNGVDVPPHQGIDQHVRRLKTVAGHQLEFDDRDGEGSVRLLTATGHQLEMLDPGGAVELTTSAGHSLLLQNTPGKIALATKLGTTVTLDDLPSSVTVSTSGGVKVTISDLGGVSVSAPSGAVSVTSASATVTATGAVSVTGSSVAVSAASLSVSAGISNFAGVVNCSTLIAQSVVSTSYTPGAGNML